MTHPMFTIYHNPKCGTSRNTLALIRHFGIDPNVIDYLKTPPPRAELAALIAAAKLSPRDVVRKKESVFAELGLDKADDGALLDAMVVHPILINRPIVVSEHGTALCRPSDIVLDLLPKMPLSDAFKEEGAHFLRDEEILADDPGLTGVLKEAHLPVEDLAEPGRSFYVFRSLSGAVLAYGGFELHGKDALLRSVVVLPDARMKRTGRNVVPLLMYRAFQKGADTAWLLTTTAAPFFEKMKFKRRERADAPLAILATREAAGLCPSSAALMSRRIGF
jgi:arsenate reductase (glutaredoxin)